MMADDAQTPTQGEPAKPGGLAQMLRGLIGRNGESHLRETLEELIEEAEERESPIDPGERALIANILKFGAMTAYDVMVPRADIAGVEVDTPVDELVATLIKQPHSRYPVYREVLDDILGVIHIKDVMAAATASTHAKDESEAPSTDPEAEPAFSLRELMRPAMVIAPSMRVLDLLLQMRLQRRHMALVVDEFGGIDGLVTIEDLVEEIVGEIEDEHDVLTGPQIEATSDGAHTADARLMLQDLESQFGDILSDAEREEDIDTIGGLVFTIAGRVPSRGELIKHDPSGVEFEVLDADPRRIKRLKLRHLDRTSRAAVEQKA